MRMRSVLLTFVSVIALLAAAPSTQPTTDQAVIGYGTCDYSDMLSVLRVARSQKPPMAIAPILMARIARCHKLIGDFLALNPLSAPPPAPWSTGPVPPPPQLEPGYCKPPKQDEAKPSKQDEATLYGELVDCVTYWKAISGTSSGATPAPPAFATARKTFYVFATGAVDPTTNALLVKSVIDRLIRAQTQTTAAPSPTPTPMSSEHWSISGRTDWSAISSFTAQCQGDPNTQGALVIEADFPVAYSNHYVLWVNTGEQVYANFQILSCDAMNYGTLSPPLSIWSAANVDGKSSTGGVPLGLLAGLAVILASNHTITTTTTTTPAPSSGGPAITTTSTTNNLTPAFIGTALSGALGPITTPTANPGWLIGKSAFGVSDNLMGILRQYCRDDSLNPAYSYFHRMTTWHADHPKLQYPYLSDGDKNDAGLVTSPDRDVYRAALSMVTYCAQFNKFQTPAPSSQ
jgi:hypothetical protein